MRWAPLVGAALLSIGCAHTVGVEDGADDGLDFAARQARLGAIERWNLNGRLAIDTGEQRYRPRFRWRQRGADLALIVDSRVPGTPELSVEGNALELTVRNGDDVRVLRDPEIELSEMVGWWLPVTSLEHWLIGQPDPDFPSGRLALGPLGTLATLRQRDWRIRYDGYRLIEGVLMPNRLTFTHARLRLTLEVADWRSVAADGQP
jgi:outer membrane lipoprotein LolB